MRGEREGVVSTEILSAIREILKDNPRGVSVTDISRKMAVNRNSVAKYLDILLISGQVEMRSYGTAKVYFLSHRIPISSLLSFSSDFIVAIDAHHSVIQVSDNYLAYARLDRESVVGKRIQESGLPVIDDPGLLPHLLAIPDRDITRSVRHDRDGDEFFFTVKLIPTVFDDGSKGVTAIIEDTTSRIRNEQALAASEEKLRSIVENSLDALYRRNLLSGYFDYFSPAVEEITGFSVQEVLTWDPDTILKRVHPDDRQRVMARKLADVPKVTQSTIDYRFLCRDGTYKWLSDRFRVTYDEENRPIVREGIVRDITERKRAEEELAASNRLLHDIIDLLPDATFVVDDAGRVVAWNRAMESLTGVPREDMLGRGDHAYAVPFYGKNRPVLIDLIDTEDPGIEPLYRTVHREGSTITAEGYVSLYQGKRRAFLQGIASPLLDSDGRRIGAIESIRDITPHRELEERLARASSDLEQRIEERTRELVRANEVLREETAQCRSMQNALFDEEQRFQTLVDSIHDVFLIANHEGCIECVNAWASSLLRKEPRAIVGKPLDSLFPPDAADGMMESIRHAIRTGKTIQRKRWIPAGGDERWFDSTVAPLRDAAGASRRVMILARDVTPPPQGATDENLQAPSSNADPRLGMS